jgi:hypothetical protein
VWNGHRPSRRGDHPYQFRSVGKVCVVTVCGGSDMQRWLPLIDQIETYAKREGCVRARIYGRKGWLRVLEGYEQKHIIMDKEPDDLTGYVYREIHLQLEIDSVPVMFYNYPRLLCCEV